MDTSLPCTSKATDNVSSVCHLCSKMFKNVSSKKLHVKRFHKVAVLKPKASCIVCSLCEEEIVLKTHERLRKHLAENHHVSIELLNFEFLSKQEYHTWKDEEKIETNYAIQTTVQKEEHKILYYDCNRSNLKGYKPNNTTRLEKSGGTIKIKGVCPSRLICTFRKGRVSVSYWKTHVGHGEDLRSKHLSKSEEKMVVEKLQSGVPPNRILEDLKKLEATRLGRINVLTTQDITNLSKKYNTQKMQDQNDMVAAALRVQQWNANGKNYAFLFKKEGESHDVLNTEDFALGLMNATMENKLRRFPDIIRMEGTHGTNRKGLDLTIVLIKDDKNVCFPVAFLLSNRLDQQIQEVFLAALKEKMEMEIQTQHFMSDDDAKYYNAWVNIMGNKHKPKRLLCTWHVVKNWNIQGKKKLQDPALKKQMKNEMKRIINETNEDRFLELCNNYLLKLQEANEADFVNYLTRYYFQDEERIKMWALCYRGNSGFNTNIAIESLNNLLKGNARVTIEKLLDTIDDLVDMKMGNRIEDHEFINGELGEVNQVVDEVQIQNKRSLQWENLQHFIGTLDDDNFTEFFEEIQGTVNKYEEKLHKAIQRRKMEKQQYVSFNKRPNLTD